MEGDKQDNLAPGAGETSKSGGPDVAPAESLLSNEGRPSQAQSNTTPMILQEQEGLEPLLLGMLAALQRIESLLEGQQKDPRPRREHMRKDNSCYGVGMDIYKSRERGREDVSINTGNIEALALSGDNSDEEVKDRTKPVSQQQLPNGRTHG